MLNMETALVSFTLVCVIVAVATAVCILVKRKLRISTLRPFLIADYRNQYVVEFTDINNESATETKLLLKQLNKDYLGSYWQEQKNTPYTTSL